jgi:hypothetical protein
MLRKLLTFAIAASAVLGFDVHALERVVFTAQLTSYGQQNARHHPAWWTGSSDITKGYTTAISNRVLKKAIFKLDAAPYPGARSAGVDVCIYIHPPGYGAHIHKLTVTQNEAICFNQHKGAETQWPASTKEIIFPGQGLLVPSGSVVACDSQGSLKKGSLPVIDGIARFSNFTCELFFDDYSQAGRAPAYQSVRAPFFDEAFVNTPNSRRAFHQNRLLTPLQINGVWVYNNTEGAANQICLSLGSKSTCKNKGSAPGKTYTTDGTWANFSEPWYPGQRLTGYCQSSASQSTPKYCAFYFMVAVSSAAGLRRDKTINPADARAYCENPHPALYILTGEPGKARINCSILERP